LREAFKKTPDQRDPRLIFETNSAE